MITWKIIFGIVLFVTSSFIAELLVMGGVSLTIGGTEYASSFLGKMLDVLAGSFIFWGILGKRAHSKVKGSNNRA